MGEPDVPKCCHQRGDDGSLPEYACDECRRAEPLLLLAREARDRRRKALSKVERLGARLNTTPPPEPRP